MITPPFTWKKHPTKHYFIGYGLKVYVVLLSILLFSGPNDRVQDRGRIQKPLNIFVLSRSCFFITERYVLDLLVINSIVISIKHRYYFYSWLILKRFKTFKFELRANMPALNTRQVKHEPLHSKIENPRLVNDLMLWYMLNVVNVGRVIPGLKWIIWTGKNVRYAGIIFLKIINS